MASIAGRAIRAIYHNVDLPFTVDDMTPASHESCFPHLEGEERQLAEEWLRSYLRLIIRIYREHLESRRQVRSETKHPNPSHPRA